MGPLAVNDIISSNTNFFLAFVIGIGFGFVLEQCGPSSSRKLAGPFYGYDMVVLNQGAKMNIFYSNGSTEANEAWLLTRQLGYQNNYVLQGGLNYWVETILNPLKPGSVISNDEIARYDFRKAASMALGGGEVPFCMTCLKSSLNSRQWSFYGEYIPDNQKPQEIEIMVIGTDENIIGKRGRQVNGIPDQGLSQVRNERLVRTHA